MYAIEKVGKIILNEFIEYIPSICIQYLECFNLDGVESVRLGANIDNRILIHYHIKRKRDTLTRELFIRWR
jgi:hypothetical protein